MVNRATNFDGFILGIPFMIANPMLFDVGNGTMTLLSSMLKRVENSFNSTASEL